MSSTIRIILILISLFISIAIISVAYYFYHSQLSQGAKLTFLVAMVSLLLPFIVSHLLPRPEESDYFPIHRPYLEPQLVIDSAKSPNFRFHFVVKNLGKLPAESLQFIYLTPYIKVAEVNLPHVRELAPDGSMSIRLPDVGSDSLTEVDDIGFTLFAYYSSVVRDKKYDFKSRFHFYIPKDELAEKSILYESATREEGKLTLEEQASLLNLKESLESESGTYMFWFRESDQQNTEPTIFVHSLTKSLIYDPTTRTITYRHNFANQKTLYLVHKFEDDKTNWKHIGFTWSSEEATIYLDGKPLASGSFKSSPDLLKYESGENLKGFSYNLYVKVLNVLTDQEKFIFDMGKSISNNRISIFLGNNNYLCFRVTDLNGISHILKLAPGVDNFKFDEFLYLNCELGYGDDFSVLKIYINGELKAITEIKHKIPFSSSFDIKGAVLGADLDGNNGGSFDLAVFIVFSRLVSVEEKKRLSSSLSKREFFKFRSFRGDQWMKVPNGSS